MIVIWDDTQKTWLDASTNKPHELMGGEYVNNNDSDVNWLAQIPDNLNLEKLPIPLGDAPYRLSKKKDTGSNYVHYKGFTKPKHDIRKAKMR